MTKPKSGDKGKGGKPANYLKNIPKREQKKMVRVTCPTCKGSGKYGNNTCGLCNGSGTILAME